MEDESTALRGKTAIVTGASRGIGRAIATELARAGAHVLLTARDSSLLREAVAEIESAGGTAASFALDLREADAPAQVVAHALSLFGGVIDIVVNNAGATKRGDFLTLTDDDWADGFALKFYGAMRLTRAAWSHLKARGGSVVFISGVGGRTPGVEFAIGGSINAALLSLTKSLADRGVADGVQVNAVNPGAVRTDRLTRRFDALGAEGVSPKEAEKRMLAAMRTTRIGEPGDIAGLVRFVVSPEGRFLQGALIDMDGGQTKTI